MDRRLHESGEDGQSTPDDHDRADQTPRAPAFSHQRTGDLEGQISNEKYACSGAEDALAETQIMVHFQPCVGEVGAINEIGDEKKMKERKQATDIAAANRLAIIKGGSRSGTGHPNLPLKHT